VSVENLFVPLHEHLSLVIVHGFEPNHQCSMANLDVNNFTLQDCRAVLERRGDYERAPPIAQDKDNPELPDRPPGWNSRTLLVLDARSMHPLVLEPLDRAEALTGLPWQRVRPQITREACSLQSR